MIFGLIIAIGLLSLVLIKSADMVIVAIRRLSRETHTSAFTISAVVLALGTSLPELFVGITSALEGSPNLSFGVVLGSNIANIALIGALTAFVVGGIAVNSSKLTNDVWIAFLAGILPVILASDKVLNRVDALILISVYLGYATGFFRQRFHQIAKEQSEGKGFVYRFFRRFSHVDSVKTKELGRLFMGLALLLASSDAIVKLSTTLATQAQIPVFLVGLFVIAIGTSLPELAFSIRSVSEHEPSMFFGNLLGSTIANSTLIIGITALIHPMNVVAFDEYLTAVIAFIAVFIAFWLFIKSKHRLERVEAGFLLLFYLGFVLAELL